MYNDKINDKEYYFFRNSEFHAASATKFTLFILSIPFGQDYIRIYMYI